MQSTSLATLFEDLTDEQRARLLRDDAIRDLADVFAAIPDPRGRRGRRYELPLLLTCLVCALLCNCNPLDAVGQWCADHQPLLRSAFGPRRFLSPSSSLYRKLLPRLSAAAIEWALAAWVRATRPQGDTEAIALDGKTIRGARSGDTAAPQVLSVSTHGSAETLIQVPISDKTNEIPVAQALIPYLPLRDRMVTADAMHAQTELAQRILDADAHYLLCIKENQPRTYRDLVDYFADPQAECVTACTEERQRGRRERRFLRVTTELAAYLDHFPHVAQAMEITRTVWDAEGLHEEVSYFITDCSPNQASPEQLLAHIRGHWSIETRHFIRDVVFGEDRSQYRTGTGPRVLAAFRNLALTLIRRTGTRAITHTRRHFATFPHEALALLTTPDVSPPG